jgi:hypothetical protein
VVQKIIDGVLCDTTQSEQIARWDYDEFLYKTKNNRYFIVIRPNGNYHIDRTVTRDEAIEWLSVSGNVEIAISEFDIELA